MNRQQRLAWIATPPGMASAALTQRKRRGDVTTHCYVVGGMRLVGHRIVLMAIEQGPALDILRPLRVTENADLMYRWRTKQAASQFVARHGIMDVHVFNLSWLDVLAIEVA